MSSKTSSSLEMQVVELHFSEAPVCDWSVIRRRAEDIIGAEIESSELPSNEGVRLFSHVNSPVTYSDGRSMPALTSILSYHRPIHIENYASEIQQSWGFRA